VGYGILALKSKKCGRICSGIWEISLKISGIWDNSPTANINGTHFDSNYILQIAPTDRSNVVSVLFADFDENYS